MGYGSRALNQLQEYFEGKFPNLKETNEENMSSENEDEIKEVNDEVSKKE